MKTYTIYSQKGCGSEVKHFTGYDKEQTTQLINEWWEQANSKNDDDRAPEWWRGVYEYYVGEEHVWAEPEQIEHTAPELVGY